MGTHPGATQDEGMINNSEYLQARFMIEPSSDGNCQVMECSRSGADVKQKLSGCQGGSTTCLASVTDIDGHQRFIEQTVDHFCICPVLSDYECIASIETVDPPNFVVSLTAPDREIFTSIVDELREADAIPRLVQISNSSDQSELQPIEFAIDSITEKQREAIRIAVERGYYEKPRGATLADLAAELDISRSAVSQRLTAVESKMVYKLVETQA